MRIAALAACRVSRASIAYIVARTLLEADVKPNSGKPSTLQDIHRADDMFVAHCLFGRDNDGRIEG
jgi:hypothetical protein